MSSPAIAHPRCPVLIRAAGLVAAALTGIVLAKSGSAVPLTAVLLACAVMMWFSTVCLRTPLIFAGTFLLVLEVIPPLYFEAFGGNPLYLTFLLLPLGAFIAVLRWPEMKLHWDPVSRGWALFIGGVGLSIPFAWWLSGQEAATVSVTRWVLLAQAGLLYYLIRGGARAADPAAERRIFSALMWGAFVSALYGIVDFLWPIPLPHPAADQFIWLDSTIVRRAQGVFYESSSFANFCGFFLVASATAFAGHKERAVGVPRWALIVFIPVLSLAVLLAFSRSTWISLAVALLAAMAVARVVSARRVVLVCAAIAVPLLIVWWLSPDLWNYLVTARIGRLFDIASDPNVATSGRFETWVRVLSIMREHPEYLLLGIGYKTLPVTRLFQTEIITDNGYLSLLLETGIVGFTGFLILVAALLSTFYRLARSGRESVAFWATVVFAIWCGELVQLLAADALTYWRNIIILAALAALTLNLNERAGTRVTP